MQYEHWYEDGMRFARKNYDNDGNFTYEVSRATSKEYDPMRPPYIPYKNKGPVLDLERVEEVAPTSNNMILWSLVLFIGWVILLFLELLRHLG